MKCEFRVNQSQIHSTVVFFCMRLQVYSCIKLQIKKKFFS